MYGSGKAVNILKKNKDKTPVQEKVVVIGPAHFGLKQDFSDGTADIISFAGATSLNKEQNKPKSKPKYGKNDGARKLWRTIDVVVGDVGGPNDGVTDDLSFETGMERSYFIGGVADMNQMYSSLWSGPSGCSPTSAANIMKYRADHGFPELVRGLSDEQLLYQLRTAMGTRSDGSTPVNNISPGMRNFARNRGVSSADAWYLNPPTWNAYKSGITNNGPNVISFVGQTYYRDHSVTGVGWVEFYYNGSCEGHQYMEVHDNVYSTPMNIYSLWS
ncbi:MAG: hypothetical protein IMW94_08490 [Thermoanaerobacter sp.]|nr:hypothetical protein [Thermoanaerobacter sp.]